MGFLSRIFSIFGSSSPDPDPDKGFIRNGNRASISTNAGEWRKLDTALSDPDVWPLIEDYVRASREFPDLMFWRERDSVFNAIMRIREL